MFYVAQDEACGRPTAKACSPAQRVEQWQWPGFQDIEDKWTSMYNITKLHFLDEKMLQANGHSNGHSNGHNGFNGHTIIEDSESESDAEEVSE